MKSRKMAALTLLMAHAWLAWTGSVAAQPITQYRANYEAIGAWTSSVPAAVEDLIRILESVNGSYCHTVQQPPDGYTQRKCSYLDHETDGVHFRMLQVVDVVHRGNPTLHTETILSGTYETRGPWLMTRIKGPPRSCPAQLQPGHPIHPISGGKSLREDLGVGRIGGQPLVALYDTMSLPPQSAPAAASAAALAAHASVSFGGFWRGNLHKRLLLQTDAAQALRSVVATRDDGSWQGFKRDDAGIWQPDADVPDRLQQIAGGWRYTDMAAQSEELYDTEGRLLSVAYINGNRLSYGYSTAGDGTPEPGLLTGLQDQTGRSVSFSYEWPAGAPRARIRQITSDAGSTFIAYDTHGNLSLITDPAGKTRQYLYERSDLPWAVTGIVDERGARLATYGYDPFGLAVETQWAGGADHYTAAYATPPKWDTTDTYDAATNILWRDHHWVAPTGLTLTDPNGAVSDISTTVINDKVYLSGRSQPAGAGCSASTSSQAFDVNGILSRRDDFNGTRSCFANDLQRKLPITSVEGLAQTDDCGSATQASSLPAPSRMTSTEWHPDWPLPVRQAGPNLLTTWVYNGQSDPFNANQIASCAAAAAALPDGKPLPLLCKRVAQATLDHSGTKRFALAGQAAVPGDPNGVDPSYTSVSLLLHMDGSSNAAGLVDSSVNAYTASAFGNTAVASAASRYGSAGLSLDGAQGTYVTAPSAALDLGANDFTVEAWVRLNAYGNFATLLSNYGQGGARGFDILTGPNGSVGTRWSQDGSSDAGSLWHANQIPLNTWAHVAVVRQGTALRIFLNGVPSAPVAINGAIFASSTPVNIGRTPDTGSGVWHLNGAVDDVRITKGVARYTAAFTPPTAGLPGKPVTPAVPSLFNTAVADEVQSWTYDADGRVLTAKGSRSDANDTTVSSYHLDTNEDHTRGDLKSITLPTGETTTFTKYAKSGQVLQSTGPTGVVTTYTYDLRQRMVSRTVGTNTTAYEYDASGQLTKVTLPDGSWVGYEYDDARRVVAVADKKGNRIEYVLDNAGNRTDQRVKDPAGELKQSLNALMDVLGRVQQAGVTDPAPATQAFPPLPSSPLPLERYEYDAQGNRTKITQGAGTLNLVTKLTYDALERVKDTTDPKNGTTRFEYDGGDRTTQVTDPRNLATQYPRNGLGDATQVISPDTGNESLTYDAARNLKTRTDSRGVLTTYGYDASDRLTAAVFTLTGQPTETVTLAYSQTGVGFSYGMGRLTSSGYPGGSAQYGYDDQGEVVSDVQRVNATSGSNTTQLTHTVGYGYTLSNLSGISYPSSRQLGLSWVDGEVTEITLGGTPLITQIEWTPFAGTVKRWGWAMASGTKSNERYFDLAGRAIRYPLGEALRDVRYDEASRIVSFTHLSADGTAQPALDQAFGYDENSRLTGITTNAASWGISYDANGNRTGMSLNGSPSTYGVEATSNRTTSITNPAHSLVFDNAGNTLSDSAADGSGYTATYNLRGQLATITKNGVTTSYTYNAAGQRVRKVSSTGPQSTVVFVYDQAGHLLGEYDQNGAALREYVWLRDTPMAMFTPDPANPSGEPLVYFIHTDHLNTPRVVVDRQNRVRWRWLAEPFGTSAPETNPSGLGVFTQNLRFPGQYADQESGLWYNYFRNYDSSKGGYTQSDPAGLVGGLNTYAYVDGNPLSFVDPQGLWLQGIPPLVEAGAALLTRQLIARAAARAAAESAARMAAMRFLTVGAATAGALSQTTAERQCGGNLYRAMTPAADGFPLIAPTARGLGVRPETDIAISQDGLVYPGTGGMSVSPTIAGLPPHRRPQDLGGTGKDPVYCTCVADLPDSLVYRPDPLNPTGHGFVEPATPTPFDFYQENIGSTRPFWRRTK